MRFEGTGYPSNPNQMGQCRSNGIEMHYEQFCQVQSMSPVRESSPHLTLGRARLIQFEKAMNHISTFEFSSIRFRHTILVVEGLHIVHRPNTYVNKGSTVISYIASLHAYKLWLYILVSLQKINPLLKLLN